MLELKSADILGLVRGENLAESGSGGSSLSTRSTGTVVTSVALGVGMVYFGTRNKGWWHVLTALGAFNLYNNAGDVVDRITT